MGSPQNQKENGQVGPQAYSNTSGKKGAPKHLQNKY
jgi:hypothetical protein